MSIDLCCFLCWLMCTTLPDSSFAFLRFIDETPGTTYKQIHENLTARLIREAKDSTDTAEAASYKA